MSRYTYQLTTLQDTKAKDVVFVPNCTTAEALEVFRWLSRKRKDFPEYREGDNVVMGLDEDVWQRPRVYREAYCPPGMACIVRTTKQRRRS